MVKKVALVLSSGGARGIAHIGAIEELENQGFSITSVSGSSIGALIGGIYAMGKLKEFSDWMCTLQRMDIFSLMDFTLSNHGLLKADRVFKKMQTFIPDVLIEDMNIPFAAVTTEITQGKEVVFTEGSFYKAVRASIAIPTIITSIEEKNRILVDGGVLNPLPMKQIKRINDDILVVVNLYDRGKETEPPDEKTIVHPKTLTNNHYLNSFLGSNSSILSIQKKIRDFIPGGDKQSLGYYSMLQSTTLLMTQRIAALSMEIYKPDIIINIPRNVAGTFDFHKSMQLIEGGRNAASQSISEYYKKIQY